jgi:hypothetical protein
MRSRYKWIAIKSLGLVSLTIILIAGGLMAAPKSLPGVKQKMNNADNIMRKIENLTDKIDKGKTLSDKQLTELDSLMEKHAILVKSAFMEAAREVEAQAKAVEKQEKATGKPGKIDLTAINVYEKAAKGFEARAKKLEQKGKNINKKIKTGAIELDKTALKKMSGKEKQEFKTFLDSKVRDKYKKKHPDVFSSMSFPSQEVLVEIQEVQEPCTVCSETIEQVLDFFVQPAHAASGAAIGVSCTAAGAVTVGATCVLGTATAIYQMQDEWNRYQKCKKDCGRWNRWCKFKCWVRLETFAA